MNQDKIGKFIAECRKEQGITQTQLADRLDITYKAVSKCTAGAQSGRVAGDCLMHQG